MFAEHFAFRPFIAAATPPLEMPLVCAAMPPPSAPRDAALPIDAAATDAVFIIFRFSRRAAAAHTPPPMRHDITPFTPP